MKIERAAPSRAHRWWNCLGSVRAEKMAPIIEGHGFTLEGSAAHRLFELCLRKKQKAAKYIDKTIYLPKDKAEWVVDADMAEHIQDGIDLVLKQVGKGTLFIEERVTAVEVDGTTSGGDLDAGWYGRYKNDDGVYEWQLHILDLKYGQGALVEAHDNLQMSIYMLGKFKQIIKKRPVDSLHMWIHQPRVLDADGLPFRHHVIEPLDIMEFEADLIAKIKDIKKPNAPLVAGPWCLYCSAHAVCATAEKAALRIARTKYRKEDRDRIGELKFKLPELKRWIKAVEDLALSMGNNGSDPTGWMMGHGRGYRKWKGDGKGDDKKLAVVRAIVPELRKRFQLSEDDLVKRQLVSVAKVEKLIPKDQRQFLKKFYYTSKGRDVLVPASDKRQGITAEAYFDDEGGPDDGMVD